MLRVVVVMIALIVPAAAQYGGPPMWSRDYRDYPPEPRQWRYGPQRDSCIDRGDCRFRDRDFRNNRPYRMPPFRYPDRRDEWYEE